MSNLRVLASYTWRSTLAGAHRSVTGSYRLYYKDVLTPTIHGHGFSKKKGFSAIDYRRVHIGSNMQMEKDMNKDKHVVTMVPSSRKPFLPVWVRWTLGAILSLLPFGKNKLEGFLRLEGQVENVAETVENVAEVVEKVAGVAEKVSASVADKLPEDSTLKNTALLVERVSKEAVKDAHLAINLIHKVDELKQEIVEKVVEPDGEPGKLCDKEIGGK